MTNIIGEENLVNEERLDDPLPQPVIIPQFYDGSAWFNIATENWVLNAVAQITPCRVATTANLTANYVNGNGNNGKGATLTNSGTNEALSIDGVTLAAGNRVLVKNQTTTFQNGIYVVTTVGNASTPWVLTRSGDFDSASQMKAGVVVNVIEGTENSITSWMLTADVTTVGTSGVVFASLASDVHLDGTTNQITITPNGDNSFVISLADNVVFSGDVVTIPVNDNTVTLPTAGMFRFNTGL
jgi:hypothetical protein